MQIGLADKEGFEPAPLEPTWILSGKPAPLSLPLARSGDGNFACGRWSCNDGSFKYIFSCHEMIHILEGSVTIDDGTRTQTLCVGDVAYFPKGLHTVWTVHGFVKKFAVFHSPHVSLARRIAGKLKKLVLECLGRRS